MIIYRGYYKNILLAAYYNKSILKEYLKTIRGLASDEYTIEASNIEEDNIYSLYSDIWLEQYVKNIYITSKEAQLLDIEVQQNFNKFVDTLENMRIYYNCISSVDVMEKHAKQLKETIHNMEEDLTTKKILKKLRKKIIDKSAIMSQSIEEYLEYIKISKESEDMNNRYRYRLITD